MTLQAPQGHGLPQKAPPFFSIPSPAAITWCQNTTRLPAVTPAHEIILM